MVFYNVFCNVIISFLHCWSKIKEVMTTEQIILGFFIGFFTYSYFKRHKAPFKQIWFCVELFLVILLAFLVIGYIKDRFKK